MKWLRVLFALLAISLFTTLAQAAAFPSSTQPAAQQDNPGSPATPTTAESSTPAQQIPDSPATRPPSLPPMPTTSLNPRPLTQAVPPLPAPLPADVGQRRPGGPSQSLGAGTGSLATTTGNTAPTNRTARSTVAALPPGPLSRLPITVTAGPNDLRVSGLGSSSAPWGIIILLTALTLIPSILICVTPFARLLVVFHFLRQALGLQTTPSNQTLIGLTLILTFFIMEPVGKEIYAQSLLPLQNGEITAFEALARGEQPMRRFMVHFVREKDAALFLEIAQEPRPHRMQDLSMRVLVPAYIVSELKSGFQIGAVLFLPFLVVDIVVASITTSVGMMQLPPVVISTPLKLLLFLMVDGWHLLIGALVRSFN